MPRRRRLPRWAQVLLGSVLVLVLGGVAAVAAFNASLDRVDVDGLAGDDAGEDDGEVRTVDHSEGAEPLTILVLGSDSRAVLTPQERRELGTGDAEGERTETIALLRLEPGAEELRMLNVPRDSLVTRCDGSRGRINAAYGIGERDGIGGISCVVQTLTAWLGVPIDHAVKADFRGFVDIVEALGGVRLWIEEPLVDANANLDLPAGCVTLDGAQALAFVRARYLDDDYGRVGRQQRFVEELRREITGMGILDDVPRTVRTATAVANSLQLDGTLTLGRLQQLAREHRATVSAPVDGRILPGSLQTDGPAFLDVDETRARELVTWFLEGEDPADRQAPRTVQDGGPSTGSLGQAPSDGSSGIDGSSEPDTLEDPLGGADEAQAPGSPGYGDGTDGGDRAATEVPVGDRCR